MRRWWVVVAFAGLMMVGCSKLFPPPARPHSHGYRASYRATVAGQPLELTVAWAPQRERRDHGEEGQRRSLVLRHDLGEAWELDEARRSVRVRPIEPGEQLLPTHGFYPLRPVRLSEFRVEQLAGSFPGWEFSSLQLSDALVGPHPCDVIRLDRFRPGGSGVSEVWHFARDLDGLVIRREVRPFVAQQFEETVEMAELTGVRIGAPDDLFEMPDSWTIERAEVPDPNGMLPAGLLDAAELPGVDATGSDGEASRGDAPPVLVPGGEAAS